MAAKGIAVVVLNDDTEKEKRGMIKSSGGGRALLKKSYRQKLYQCY
ncbi:MAG TPA: hypothetical protein VJP79_02945 [Nitrososphaera sp.]|nr:hypothetical protein [Nitrososphaera sp.]